MVLLTTSIGLVGFVFLNYPKLNEIQLILINVGAIVLIIAQIFVVKKLISAIDKLKDL